MSTRGRPAAQPDRASLAADKKETATSLTARLNLEDSHSYTFDLQGFAGATQLRSELVQAVVSWTATSIGGRRVLTVEGKRRALSSFLKYVENVNGEESQRRLQTVADITPFHVRHFHEHLLQTHAPGTVDDYYSGIRILLRYAPGVRDATLREVTKRQERLKPQTKIDPYSPSELQMIRRAARRVVVGAHARIHTNYQEAMRDVGADAASTVKGRALYEVLTIGKPQTLAGYEALSALGRTYRNFDKARRHLFLSNQEALAAVVLLVCHSSLNLSPLISAKHPLHVDSGIVQLNVDKPRRGPGRRFWPEIISDGDGDDEAAAKDVLMIAEATEPARVWLAKNGQPSDRLIIRWPFAANKPHLGLPAATTRPGVRSNAGGDSSWIPEGVRISFPRLRRSIPGRGVTKEPTHHSPSSNLHYIRTDPVALKEHQLAVLT